MRIEIIDGIKYRLDEDELTAEVCQKMGYKGDIIIPETVVFNEVTYRVTRIAEKTFDECKSLTSIVIPDSVTSIGEWAFSDCSSLTSITFNGTKAQWQGVILGYAWYKVPATVVHCTDGDVEI